MNGIQGNEGIAIAVLVWLFFFRPLPMFASLLLGIDLARRLYGGESEEHLVIMVAAPLLAEGFFSSGPIIICAVTEPSLREVLSLKTLLLLHFAGVVLTNSLAALLGFLFEKKEEYSGEERVPFRKAFPEFYEFYEIFD